MNFFVKASAASSSVIDNARSMGADNFGESSLRGEDDGSAGAGVTVIFLDEFETWRSVAFGLSAINLKGCS